MHEIPKKMINHGRIHILSHLRAIPPCPVMVKVMCVVFFFVGHGQWVT